MKDRLLTFGLAMGALAAFYAVLAPKPSAPQEQITRPLSIEAGPNGYLGLQRWLTQEGVAIVSLRERFTGLTDASAGAPTGNLLISTAPQIYPLRAAEVASLQGWITAGNTLLVVAGLSDTPEWAMGAAAGAEMLEQVKTMTGLTFTQIPVTVESAKDQTANSALLAVTRLAEPLRTESAPNGEHPLLAGVQSIVAVSEFPTAHWQATSDSSVILELASDQSSGVPALWLLPYGEGQVVVSAYGSILTNKVLDQGDNAQLLANIVRWSLGEKGRVIIDDAHQGLVSFYDPDRFFGDSRLHRSVLWLLALWLVFVLGPRRLRGTAHGWNPLDVTSFVRATGGFMARVLRPAAAGQRLFANFFDEIRGRLGLAANGAPVWEWLAGQAVIAPADLDRLHTLHAQVAGRRRVDLVELHNLVARIRAQLN